MALPRQSNWRTHLAAAAIQVGLVALAATCALMLYQARLAARSEAVHQAESLARVLQDSIETEVKVADLSLRNVDLDLQFIERNNLSPELRKVVLTNDALSAQVYGTLLVADEAGQVIFFSDGVPAAGVEVSSRAYFINHRDHSGAGLGSETKQPNRG